MLPIRALLFVPGRLSRLARTGASGEEDFPADRLLGCPRESRFVVKRLAWFLEHQALPVATQVNDPYGVRWALPHISSHFKD